MILIFLNDRSTNSFVAWCSYFKTFFKRYTLPHTNIHHIKIYCDRMSQEVKDSALSICFGEIKLLPHFMMHNNLPRRCITSLYCVVILSPCILISYFASDTFSYVVLIICPYTLSFFHSASQISCVESRFSNVPSPFIF